MTKNFFTNLWQSSTSFNFYRKVASQPFFTTFKYLIMLVLLITVTMTIKYSIYLNRGINETTEWAKANLPEIEIKDGKVSIKEKQPFFVEKGIDFVFIIDTTGTVTSIGPEYKNGILLTQNRLIYKESEMATRNYDLSKLAKGGLIRIDAKSLDRLKGIFKRLSFPFILIGLTIYSLVAKLIQVVVFSLVSLITNKVINGSLKYGDLINIGTYALTPVTLLATTTILLGISIPLFWILYSFLYAGFLIVATRRCGMSNEDTTYGVQRTT